MSFVREECGNIWLGKIKNGQAFFQVVLAF
jgi:hypothetical protein